LNAADAPADVQAPPDDEELRRIALSPRRAHPPLGPARFRVSPEDFEVEEQMAIERSGEGEHLWLRLRKRGLTTEALGRSLAQALGLPRSAIGYAGLKDRHAVTTQWFSLLLPPQREPADWAAVLPEAVELLERERHGRKLRIGALQGNAFRLRLHGLSTTAAQLDARLHQAKTQGVPNYFGPQRFGRAGLNLPKARAFFRGELKTRDRKLRGLLISSARSLLFNALLDARVEDGSWARGMDGEPLMLAGSTRFFSSEALDAELRARIESLDVHPSGPLWGRGEPPSRGPARARELALARRYAAWTEGLEAAGLSQERRALRVVPAELNSEWEDAHTLSLSFTLPAGAYATTVLAELFELEQGPEDQPRSST
jgi:tRNA pseudouridine13 synthase